MLEKNRKSKHFCGVMVSLLALQSQRSQNRSLPRSSDKAILNFQLKFGLLVFFSTKGYSQY